MQAGQAGGRREQAHGARVWRGASVVLLLLSSCLCRGDELAVAVASNFMGPMQELAARFESASGHRLNLSSGSSGRFHAQLQNGAPFALLLSADQAIPAALEEAGLTVPGSRFTYATGRLVLWSVDAALVDQQAAVLRQGDFRHLALANPRLAPYGQAAVEVLQALGLEESTRARWVMGENIAQAYQFIVTGNAELGFVALSQVIDRDSGALAQGSGWIVPTDLHAPILQDAVLVKGLGESAAARELWEFLQGAEAEGIIRAWGYALPAR